MSLILSTKLPIFNHQSPSKTKGKGSQEEIVLCPRSCPSRDSPKWFKSCLLCITFVSQKRRVSFSSQVRYTFADSQRPAKHFGRLAVRSLRTNIQRTQISFFSSFLHFFHNFDVPLFAHLFLVTLTRKGR